MLQPPRRGYKYDLNGGQISFRGFRVWGFGLTWTSGVKCFGLLQWLTTSTVQHRQTKCFFCDMSPPINSEHHVVNTQTHTSNARIRTLAFAASRLDLEVATRKCFLCVATGCCQHLQGDAAAEFSASDTAMAADASEGSSDCNFSPSYTVYMYHIYIYI